MVYGPIVDRDREGAAFVEVLSFFQGSGWGVDIWKDLFQLLFLIPLYFPVPVLIFPALILVCICQAWQLRVGVTQASVFAACQGRLAEHHCRAEGHQQAQEWALLSM